MRRQCNPHPTSPARPRQVFADVALARSVLLQSFAPQAGFAGMSEVYVGEWREGGRVPAGHVAACAGAAPVKTRTLGYRLPKGWASGWVAKWEGGGVMVVPVGVGVGGVGGVVGWWGGGRGPPSEPDATGERRARAGPTLP